MFDSFSALLTFFIDIVGFKEVQFFLNMWMLRYPPLPSLSSLLFKPQFDPSCLAYSHQHFRSKGLPVHTLALPLPLLLFQTLLCYFKLT